MKSLTAMALTFAVVTVASVLGATGPLLAVIALTGAASAAWFARCSHPAEAVRLTYVIAPDGVTRIAIVECTCGRVFPFVRDVAGEQADPGHTIGRPVPAACSGAYEPAKAVAAADRADRHAQARRRAEDARTFCRPAVRPSPRRRRNVTPISDGRRTG